MKYVRANKQPKRTILITVVGFVCLMLMLTVLSRVVASFAVVEVEATTLARATISDVVETSTTVKMRQEVAVRTEAEQTIETLYVSIGDTVSPGDALFKVRGDDLNKKITELEEDRHLNQLRIDSLNQQIIDTRDAATSLPSASYESLSEQVPSNENSSQNAPQTSNESVISELNYQLTTAQYERDNLDRKLLEFYSLRDAGGMASAPVGGTISGVISQVGDVTSQAAVVRIADNSAGGKLVFSVSADKAAFITQESELLIKGGANTKAIQGITLAGVTQNPTDSSMMDVTLHVPAESAQVGSLLEVKIVISSASYDSCIPLSALHQNSSGSYVFVVDERNTALGVEQVAHKVQVTLVAQDSYSAAVEGLGREQLVIIKSSKIITDTDRVMVP